MTNELVSQTLSMIADLEEIRGEQGFRVVAYRRAALHVRKMAEDIAEVANRGELMELPGIGKAIAAKIEDIVKTGTTKRLEELLSEVPSELLVLLKIPGLGPRTASRLYLEAGVKGIADLETALKDGSILDLKGFGPKKAESFRKGLVELKTREPHFNLSYARPAAATICEHLRQCVPGIRAQVAGSVRRWKESVKDLDIVAAVPEDRNEELAGCFLGMPGVAEVVSSGATKSAVRLDSGINVDLRTVRPEEFGTTLHHFTGSKEHNVRLRSLAKAKGLKINEYGVFSGDERLMVHTEEELYALLEMDYVVPELREDMGEIEAALEKRLPHLVQLEDLRGDLHCHSTWSDGIDTIEVMAEAARARGYEYIAMTDHSQALAFARGLTAERLMQQALAIDEINSRLEGFRILKGIEVDILADGSIDLPDEVLAALDFVVASIHSGFRHDEERIWRRLEAACNNPHVDVIGHPTGRIIGQRPGYPVDMHRLVDLARQTGTALEVNSSPDRMDMSDRFARIASDAGVKCTISTDAHSRRGYDNIVYGLATARRGWYTRADVLNTLSLTELLEYLMAKPGRVGGFGG